MQAFSSLSLFTSQNAHTWQSRSFRKLLISPKPWGPHPITPMARRLEGDIVPFFPRAEEGSMGGNTAAAALVHSASRANLRRVNLPRNALGDLFKGSFIIS